MAIRHKKLRDATINAGGKDFQVDSEGLMSPQPDAQLASSLLMLANYEEVEAAVQAPAPAKKSPKTTTKTTKAASKKAKSTSKGE